MNHDQLLALLAVVDEGSFEAAAWRLGVSASAVSQRIKALEAGVGRVVVQRSSPCTATEAGFPLLRMARQVSLLQREVRAELGLDGGATGRLDVAINADSFATWLRPLLQVAADWPDVSLRIELEDQEYSAGLLRRGQVVGAVTSAPAPVAGCRVELLGSMRYLPVATPTLAQRFRADTGFDWASAPTLRLNDKDDLQVRYLRDRAGGGATDGRRAPDPPTAQIPTSEGFVEAVRAGLGWALIPETQIADDVPSGRLMLLDDGYLDVELFWQVWRLESVAIERLTDAVHTCATVLR